MEFKIALIRGDGIGPEVVNGAVTVIDKVAREVRPQNHLC